ncbi:hypothetical protein BGX21_000721 [Mortierella sp. AD011]|nr:hypothetical protein BGX20_004418 [Mortierella sp. AD010]KAF9386702.1 hypothetical protein BGX21_000721 [Mortierella sp. AD011]
MAEEDSQYQSQQPHQGFIATIGGPCHGPVRVPVKIHEQTGLKYIPMSSIRAMYPDMIRLEIEGETIKPNVGFDFHGIPGCPQAQRVSNHRNDGSMAIDDAVQESGLIAPRKVEDGFDFDFRAETEGGDNSVKIGHAGSMEDTSAHTKNWPTKLAEVKADKNLNTVAEQLGFEGMVSRRNIQFGGCRPNESVEWIHFYPGKSICVVHDCSSIGWPSSSEQQQQLQPTNPNPTSTPVPYPAVPQSTDVPESLFRQSWCEIKAFILEQNQNLRQEIKEMNNIIATSLQYQQVHPAINIEQSWPEARPTRTDSLRNMISSTGAKQPKAEKPVPHKSRPLSLLTNSSLKNSYPSQGKNSRLGRSYERYPGEDDCRSWSSRERHSVPSGAYFKPNDWPGRDVAHTSWPSWDRRRNRCYMWHDGSQRCNTETSEIDQYIPRLDDHHTRDTKKSTISSDSTEKRRARMSSTNTRAFRFTESDLVKFVEGCKGSILSDTLAVTVSLKSPQEAQSFYNFLASIDYHGRYLDIRLAWDWSQHDMEDLVSTIEASNIRTLCLDCDKRSEPNKSIPSKSQHNPLVSLLGIRTLADLRLIAAPEILRESQVRIPSSMSHLSTLRIQLDASTQHARFIDVIKRTTCLRRLILDSLPNCYREYLELIKQALAQDRQGYEYHLHLPGTPASMDIQFNHFEYAVLIIKINRATGEFREFSLDFHGTKADQVEWKPILSSSALAPLASLTTLRLKDLSDSSWAPFLLGLTKAHHSFYDSHNERHLDVKRMKILDFRADCKMLGSSGLQDMCDLIFHIRSTLLTLKLTNLNFPTIFPDEETLTALKREGSKEEGELSSSSGSSETRNWAYFFKSLRFSVLERLQIEDANLGDADMKTLVKCLKGQTPWDQRYGLNKLVLFNTNVTAQGTNELIVASGQSRWNIKIDIRNEEGSHSE